MADETGLTGQQIWDLQEGEPPRWFARFETFRLLGAARSIQVAFEVTKAEGGVNGGNPGTVWYSIAKKWRWMERAKAWDVVERARYLAEEKERREDARRRRLEIITTVKEQAFNALQKAELGDLTAGEAREMIMHLRLLLMDAMKAERLEYGEATDIVEQQVGFSADDMAKAEAELAEWNNENGLNAASPSMCLPNEK